MTVARGLPSGSRAGSRTLRQAGQLGSCSESSVGVVGETDGGAAGVVAGTGAVCSSARTEGEAGRRGTMSGGEDSGSPGNHRGTEGAIPGSLAPFSLLFSVMQVTSQRQY